MSINSEETVALANARDDLASVRRAGQVIPENLTPEAGKTYLSFLKDLNYELAQCEQVISESMAKNENPIQAYQSIQKTLSNLFDHYRILEGNPEYDCLREMLPQNLKELKPFCQRAKWAACAETSDFSSNQKGEETKEGQYSTDPSKHSKSRIVSDPETSQMTTPRPK